MDKAQDCPFCTICPMYDYVGNDNVVGLWRALYCDKAERFPECYRYRLRSKGEPVPPNLLPNGTHLPAPVKH